MGKGTVWVPAAHGSRREIDSDPEGVNRPASPRPPLRKNITPSRTVDPSRVGRSKDRQPWAAGINSIPLPTAIQGSPLRGLRTGSGPISTPSVSSQRCGICSAPVEREEGRRGDRVRGFSQRRPSVPFEAPAAEMPPDLGVFGPPPSGLCFIHLLAIREILMI